MDMGGESRQCQVVQPSAEELSVIVHNTRCSEPDCGREFVHANALRLHVVRHHQRRALTRYTTGRCRNSIFICPVDPCISNKKYFSTFKALKQHYMKIHAPRPFLCSLCKTSSFATEALLRAHEKSCACKYACDCGAVYSHLSTLSQHVKKHNHKLILAVQRLNGPVEERENVISSTKTRDICSNTDPPTAISTSPRKQYVSTSIQVNGVEAADSLAVTADRKQPAPSASVSIQADTVARAVDSLRDPGVAMGLASAADSLHMLASIALSSALARRTREAGAQTTASGRTAAVGRACQTSLTAVGSTAAFWAVRSVAAQCPPLVPVISIHTQTLTGSSGSSDRPGKTPYESAADETRRSQEWISDIGVTLIVNGVGNSAVEDLQTDEDAKSYDDRAMDISVDANLGDVGALATGSDPDDLCIHDGESVSFPGPFTSSSACQTPQPLQEVHTQTLHEFEDIEHLLLDAETEQLFPELSGVPGTDCFTQTPWQLESEAVTDCFTQTPWQLESEAVTDCFTQTPWQLESEVVATTASSHTQTHRGQ